MSLSKSLRNLLPGLRAGGSSGRVWNLVSKKSYPPASGCAGGFSGTADESAAFAEIWKTMERRNFPTEPSPETALKLPWYPERLIVPSLCRQLTILKEALHLTTSAVLWSSGADEAFTPLAIVSDRSDEIIEGPYKAGKGLLGALVQGHEKISIHEVKPDYPPLPYYGTNCGVGSLFAMEIPAPTHFPQGGANGRGFLLGDRLIAKQWSEWHGKLFSLTAAKLGEELAEWLFFLEKAQECHRMKRLCHGLRQLNIALGLEAVCDAALKAVSDMVPADFLTISIVEGEHHRVVRARGVEAASFLGEEFPLEEGLVGQVLKKKVTLPASPSYGRPFPLFKNDMALDSLHSLLVVPLCGEKQQSRGALAIACHRPGKLTEKKDLEVIELFSAQVGIKIDLARSHEAISHQATTDGLTGLANRRTFHRGFGMMIERAARGARPLCLILCDVDHFKKINDTHGHPFGDEVLRRIAALVGRAVRKVDLAARYGGEEFAILLEDSNEEGGLLFAERIRSEIEKMVIRNGKDVVRVTMSFGLAALASHGESQEALLERADQALYRAKESGRNRIVSSSAAASAQ